MDGDPAIGWGDPRSDFYALPLDEMQTALRDLSAQTDRLWHYRIYDTVNDPQGAIRAALETGWTLLDDRVYPGEANLRVQGWQGMRQALSSYLPPTVATFDGWLALAPGARRRTVHRRGRRRAGHPARPVDPQPRSAGPARGALAASGRRQRRGVGSQRTSRWAATCST